jgi:hypothetical protein
VQEEKEEEEEEGERRRRRRRRRGWLNGARPGVHGEEVIGAVVTTSVLPRGGGIGAASPGCVEPNGDLVNEVADADD